VRTAQTVYRQPVGASLFKSKNCQPCLVRSLGVAMPSYCGLTHAMACCRVSK